MIQLTYQDIRAEGFNPAFAKLINASLPAKTARKLAKLAKLINKYQMESDEKYTSILTQYAEPNPDSPDGSAKVKSGQEEEFKKTVAEFLDTPVELDQNPISMESIKNVELSAFELLKIEKLVVD